MGNRRISEEPKGTPPMPPPPGNKALIAGLIKGNQWVFIVPDHKAGYFLGGVALGGVPLDSHQTPRVTSLEMDAKRLPTWRIIPVSKWLITMVSKSPNWGYSPYKSPKWIK